MHALYVAVVVDAFDVYSLLEVECKSLSLPILVGPDSSLGVPVTRSITGQSWYAEEDATHLACFGRLLLLSDA